MTKDKQTTDASKVELTDEQLENAQGGALDHKIDIDILSATDTTRDTSVTLNFSKVEFEYAKEQSVPTDGVKKIKL